MRLIDADNLKAELFDANWLTDNDEHMVEEIVERQSTVDAEPMRHGRREVFYENLQEQLSGCQCSVCGYTFFGRISGSHNFCPMCGAKMDRYDNATH